MDISSIIVSCLSVLITGTVSLVLAFTRYLEKKQDRDFDFKTRHKSTAIETFLVSAAGCIYNDRPCSGKIDVTAAYAIASQYVEPETRKLMHNFVDMAYTTNRDLKQEYFDAIIDRLRDEQPRAN